MDRRTVVRLTVAATILIGGCSAAGSSSSGRLSPASTASAPSAAPPSPSPTVVAPSVAAQSLASTAAAAQPQTIHLIVHPINDTEVPVGKLTGGNGQGDYILGDDPAIDVATGDNVGTMAYECFLVDTGSTLYHCPGNTITLTGRGQIVFTEVLEHVTGGPPTTAPITGGTGEFLGVTGTVTASKVAEGGDFVINFTK